MRSSRAAVAAFACAIAAVIAPPSTAGSATPLAVAAENEDAARAAVEVLEQGGTAADAAIAASLVLGVTAPVSCGIGGGGFALVYDARETKGAFLDYRETAPARFDQRAFDSKDPGAKIGVPGEVAGLVELHRRWAAKSLADDIAPAVRAAETGFAVSSHLAKSLGSHGAKVRASTGLAALFAPTTEARTTVRMPALAATLRRIGSEGARAFYQGAVAADLARAAQAAGGTLDERDLLGYRPVTRDPLRGTWEGYSIVTAPAPSAGGLMLLETLGLYSRAELSRMGASSARYQHMVAEAFRASIADRIHYAGDPAFVPDRSAALLEPDRLRTVRARIGDERTHAPARFGPDEHGTTHLVVRDRSGNIVSLTTTVNSPFGSGVVAPRSGVLLNDELDDFTSPGPNAPRAGARPVSSMTPTIVLRDGVPVVALGGSGGLRISQNVTQVLLRRLVFSEGAEEAVAAPRFFAPLVGPSLLYGPGQLPRPDVAGDLIERGEQVGAVPEDTTAVQMIAIGGGVSAAADPRKGGIAIVR